MVLVGTHPAVHPVLAIGIVNGHTLGGVLTGGTGDLNIYSGNCHGNRLAIHEIVVAVRVVRVSHTINDVLVGLL